MSKISYKIGTTAWEFNLISSLSYTRKFGKGSEAICLLKEHEVWFNKSDFSLAVIAHELMHIYFLQSAHNSSDLDAHQTEEVAAEIVANTWSILPMIINDIFTQLSSKA